MQCHERADIVTDFKQKTAVDKITLPMRDINSLTKSKMENCTVNNSIACKPSSMQEAMQWVVHFLDDKYETTDLRSIVSTNCTQLSLHDQHKLLELHTEYEELFDATPGDLNTKPISIKLKEGAKSYHGRPFPVPRIPKSTQRNNNQRMK